VPRTLTVMQLLPALESGGVERSTLEIGAALVDAGHHSLVVSAGGRLVPELERGRQPAMWHSTSGTSRCAPCATCIGCDA
jgi:hypothetical protein